MSDNEVRHVPVVVVGAGPTGITAATLLAQYGVETVVLDRWGEVYPRPRAVHLDDEVYRILARLGIADAFAEISRPALGLQLRDRRQRVLAEFTRETRPGRHGFPTANMFDQPELEALLRVNLTRHRHAELRCGAEVVEIAPAGDGRVRVTYTGGGTRYAVDADYLLGCDGANSMVRRYVGAVMTDMRFEQRWLVVDVDTDADLKQWDGVHQVCDTARAGTYMRVGERRYRWEFRLLPGEKAGDFGTLEALRPLIAPWTDGVEDLRLIRTTEYTFRAQVAERWRRDNVFLLGDAAHLTPPFIGQGMGAGVRDAMNLAWKLAGVLSGDLDGEVLDTYETERKPHARTMIRLALGIGWAMTGGGRLGDVLRRVIGPATHRIPAVRAMVTDSVSPPLRRSALVHRGRLAGRLCPNALLEDMIRLDDECGLGFTVVTSATLDPTERALVECRGARVQHAAAGSALATWLRSEREPDDVG